MTKLILTLLGYLIMFSLTACKQPSKIDKEPQRKDAVTYDTMVIKRGGCIQVDKNTWVNHNNGYYFDVYYNDRCEPEDGQFCDNVSTQFDTYNYDGWTEPGAAKVCWVDNVQYSGVRLDSDYIELKIVEFR